MRTLATHVGPASEHRESMICSRNLWDRYWAYSAGREAVQTKTNIAQKHKQKFLAKMLKNAC